MVGTVVESSVSVGKDLVGSGVAGLVVGTGVESPVSVGTVGVSRA